MVIVVATHALRHWYGIGISRMVQGTQARFIVRRYHRGANRRTRTAYVTECSTTEVPIGGQSNISTILITSWSGAGLTIVLH